MLTFMLPLVFASLLTFDDRIFFLAMIVGKLLGRKTSVEELLLRLLDTAQRSHNVVK